MELTTSVDLLDKAIAKTHTSSAGLHEYHTQHLSAEVPSSPIPVIDVLESVGLDDAVWVLEHALPMEQKSNGVQLLRLFACDCAEHVLYWYEQSHRGSHNLRECIETARKYAVGRATDDELEDAGIAAWASAKAVEHIRSASWAAESVAWCCGPCCGPAIWVTPKIARSSMTSAVEQERERAWQESKLREYLRRDFAAG